MDNLNQTKDFLNRLQLSHLVDVFSREKITVEILSDMTHDDLKQIGITAFGDRYLVLRYIILTFIILTFIRHKLVKAAKRECVQASTSSAFESEQPSRNSSVSTDFL